MKTKTKTNLLVDILILIVFLIVYEEEATGTVIHEWLGIAIGLIFIIHIILHWTWLVVNTKLFLHRMRNESRINYVLDVLIFIGFTTVIFSGIMISESFLPTFGMKTGRSHFWQEIHVVSVDITLFLTALHFAMHWKWIVNNFKRYIISPLKGENNNKIPEQVIVRTDRSRSTYFSSLGKVSFQLFIILAFAGLISLTWYAASGTIPAESNTREFNQRRGQDFESRSNMEFDKRPGRSGIEHRGRHNENGHHGDAGFFRIEFIKNLLIFSIFTIVVTGLGAKMKGKKKVKMPITS